MRCEAKLKQSSTFGQVGVVWKPPHPVGGQYHGQHVLKGGLSNVPPPPKSGNTISALFGLGGTGGFECPPPRSGELGTPPKQGKRTSSRDLDLQRQVAESNFLP